MIHQKNIMKAYIALLRGINVSGQKIIKMNDLKIALSSLEFQNINTYIQSGNIVFQSEESSKGILEGEIHNIIFKHFGFDVPVFVISLNELEIIHQKNPFLTQKGIEKKELYVAFFADLPDLELLKDLKYKEDQVEEYLFGDNVLYLRYPDGVGKSKFNHAYLERKLKVKSTIRNWNTVSKLIELGNK